MKRKRFGLWRAMKELKPNVRARLEREHGRLRACIASDNAKLKQVEKILLT